VTTVFLRLLGAEDKAEALRAAIRASEPERDSRRFEVDVRTFASVPRSPFAYWVSKQLLRLFADVPTFDSIALSTIGAFTKNDFRYLRLAFEVAPTNVARSRTATCRERWVAFSKGGAFSQHYADVYLTVNWKDDGHELKADISEYRGARGWGYQ
jgi:hypothetical protein